MTTPNIGIGIEAHRSVIKQNRSVLLSIVFESRATTIVECNYEKCHVRTISDSLPRPTGLVQDMFYEVPFGASETQETHFAQIGSSVFHSFCESFHKKSHNCRSVVAAAQRSPAHQRHDTSGNFVTMTSEAVGVIARWVGNRLVVLLLEQARHQYHINRALLPFCFVDLEATVRDD